MKTHSNKPAQLCVAAFALLTLASCVAPDGYVGQGYASQNNGLSIYRTLPPGYAGNAYYHGNRYYSGGRYETGAYNYQGRRYDSRYQHGNGQYLYGGHHQHHPGNHSSPGHRSHVSTLPNGGPGMGLFPGGNLWRP